MPTGNGQSRPIVLNARLSTHNISAWNQNTSIQNKPQRIHHSVFTPHESPSSIETDLGKIGVVALKWRYTTRYDFLHYRITSREVLYIAHGRAKLCFGGEENPDRIEPVVSQGDVLIVPAGVTQRLLEDMDGGFQMAGS